MINLNSFKDLLKRPLISERVEIGRYGDEVNPSSKESITKVTKIDKNYPNFEKFEDLFSYYDEIIKLKPVKNSGESADEYTYRLSNFFKQYEPELKSKIYKSGLLGIFNMIKGDKGKESPFHYVERAKRWIARQNEEYPRVKTFGRGEATGSRSYTKNVLNDKGELSKVKSSTERTNFWDIPSYDFILPIVSKLDEQNEIIFNKNKERNAETEAEKNKPFIKFFQRFDKQDGKNWIAQQLLSNLDIIKHPKFIKKELFDKSNITKIDSLKSKINNLFESLYSNKKLGLDNKTSGVELSYIINYHSVGGYERDFNINPSDFLTSIVEEEKNQWSIYLDDEKNLKEILATRYVRLLDMIDLGKHSEFNLISNNLKKGDFGNDNLISAIIPQELKRKTNRKKDENNIDNEDDNEELNESTDYYDSDDEFGPNDLEALATLQDHLNSEDDSKNSDIDDDLELSISKTSRDKEIDDELKILDLLRIPKYELSDSDQDYLDNLEKNHPGILDVYRKLLARALDPKYNKLLIPENKKRIENLVNQNYKAIHNRFEWARKKGFTPYEYKQLINKTNLIYSIIHNIEYKYAIYSKIKEEENKNNYTGEDYILAIIEGLNSRIEVDTRGQMVAIITKWQNNYQKEYSNIKRDIRDKNFLKDQDEDIDDSFVPSENDLQRAAFDSLLTWLNGDSEKAKEFRKYYKEIKKEDFNSARIKLEYQNINAFKTFLKSENVTTYLSEQVKSAICWLNARFYALGYEGTFMEKLFKWLIESSDRKAEQARHNLTLQYDFKLEDFSAEKYPTLVDLFDELYIRDTSLCNLSQKLVDNTDKLNLDSASRIAARDVIINAANRITEKRLIQNYKSTLKGETNYNNILMWANERNIGEIMYYPSFVENRKTKEITVSKDQKKAGDSIKCKTIGETINKLKNKYNLQNDNYLEMFGKNMSGYGKFDSLFNFAGYTIQDAYSALLGEKYTNKLFGNIKNYKLYKTKIYRSDDDQYDVYDVTELKNSQYTIDDKTGELKIINAPKLGKNEKIYRSFDREHKLNQIRINDDRSYDNLADLASRDKDFANNKITCKEALINLAKFIDNDKIKNTYIEFISNADEKSLNFVYNIIFYQFNDKIKDGWTRIIGELNLALKNAEAKEEKYLAQQKQIELDAKAHDISLDTLLPKTTPKSTDGEVGAIVFLFRINDLYKKISQEMIGARRFKNFERSKAFSIMRKNYIFYMADLIMYIVRRLNNFLLKQANLDFLKGKIHVEGLINKQPWNDVKVIATPNDVPTDDNSIFKTEKYGVISYYEADDIITDVTLMLECYKEDNILYNLPKNDSEAKEVVDALLGFINIFAKQYFNSKFYKEKYMNSNNVAHQIYNKIHEVFDYYYGPNFDYLNATVFYYAFNNSEYTSDILPEDESVPFLNALTSDDSNKISQREINKATRLYNIENRDNNVEQTQEYLKRQQELARQAENPEPDDNSNTDLEGEENNEVLMTLSQINKNYYDDEAEYDSNSSDLYRRH